MQNSFSTTHNACSPIQQPPCLSLCIVLFPSCKTFQHCLNNAGGMMVKYRVLSAAAAVEMAEYDQGPCRGKPVGCRVGGEVDTDTESTGSSMEEGESPRLAARWRWKWRKASAAGGLHSQVLKVMEEDRHLGEDLVVNGLRSGGSHADHQMAILSRPNLPCSPLSGKGSAVKAAVH